MKISKFLSVNFFLAIAFLMVGCASSKPLTQSIIDETGGNTEIQKFQYYVSTKLKLNDVWTTKDQGFTDSGTAKITNVVKRNRIIIRKKTMGEVLNRYLDESNNLILEVGFDEDDSKRLLFKQDRSGTDEKFYLVFENLFSKTVAYGGNMYTVDFSGDRPYLIIKILKQSKEKITTKWVKGRKVKS